MKLEAGRLNLGGLAWERGGENREKCVDAVYVTEYKVSHFPNEIFKCFILFANSRYMNEIMTIPWVFFFICYFS